MNHSAGRSPHLDHLPQFVGRPLCLVSIINHVWVLVLIEIDDEQSKMLNSVEALRQLKLLLCNSPHRKHCLLTEALRPSGDGCWSVQESMGWDAKTYAEVWRWGWWHIYLDEDMRHIVDAIVCVRAQLIFPHVGSGETGGHHLEAQKPWNSQPPGCIQLSYIAAEYSLVA